jgi:hypothetical protein
MSNLEDRISKLKAQVQTLENKRVTQARKDETRLKVLLGAFVLHQVQTRDASVAEVLRALIEGEMPKFLVRERDLEFWNKMAPAVSAAPEAVQRTAGPAAPVRASAEHV